MANYGLSNRDVRMKGFLAWKDFNLERIKLIFEIKLIFDYFDENHYVRITFFDKNCKSLDYVFEDNTNVVTFTVIVFVIRAHKLTIT